MSPKTKEFIAELASYLFGIAILAVLFFLDRIIYPHAPHALRTSPQL